MVSTEYDKAFDLWSSFREEVMFNHRFFPAHPLLDKLGDIVKRFELKVECGAIYYRARIIDDITAKNEHMVAKCYGNNSTEEDRKWYRNKANKFRGLTKEGSYVPPNPMLIRDGRSNSKFIRFLYMSESPTTAIFEVKPTLYGAVNVAEIEVKEPLRIANIAVDIEPKQERSFDEWLLCSIQSAFSSPTNNPDDYIPSQVIAEFIRHLGYDGIKYNSSLHKDGYNLTVFDVTKCEPISSTDLRLENIKISLRPAIGAENIGGRFEYIIDNIPSRLDKEKGILVECSVGKPY